jgi:ribonuclease HII
VEVGEGHDGGIIIEMKGITKWGIDEAGRGPLAGPVAVAVFGMKEGFLLKGFPKGRDSKKMSEAEREKWFAVFSEEKKKGNVFFEVAFSSASCIDKKGIVRAINAAMEKCLNQIALSSQILLDGALLAPARFLFQKTIINGDEKEKLIACASIVAKVSRDRLMKKISKKYPEYLFEVHKGYGTARHREILLKNGLTKLHRKSFCNLWTT